MLCTFSQGKTLLAMSTAIDASRFESVPLAPADPILGVSEAFKRSENEKKLNLGVGAYRTEELQPMVLGVVKKVSLCTFRVSLVHAHVVPGLALSAINL